MTCLIPGSICHGYCIWNSIACRLPLWKNLANLSGEIILNVSELFVCSHAFVSITERANGTKRREGFQAPVRHQRTFRCLSTLARIHDEATESGDSSDFGIHDHVNAGADERSNNSCEDNK